MYGKRMSRTKWINEPLPIEYIPNKKKRYVLLSYDISNPKRLNRVASVCKGFGYRVQASVFEAYLTTKQIQQLVKKLENIINHKVDNIRIYGIQGKEPVYLMGDCKVVENEEFVFVGE
jgi:CRISPR-associated protein Cas2